MRRCEAMGKLVFGMMQSLDGYVDGVAGGLALPPPGAALSRHFNDRVRGLAGCLYGRRIYEIMRYWDEDRPEWDGGDPAFAAAWRVRRRRCNAAGGTRAVVGGSAAGAARRREGGPRPPRAPGFTPRAGVGRLPVPPPRLRGGSADVDTPTAEPPRSREGVTRR